MRDARWTLVDDYSGLLGPVIEEQTSRLSTAHATVRAWRVHIEAVTLGWAYL